jgi:hypothetical protein
VLRLAPWLKNVKEQCKRRKEASVQESEPETDIALVEL